jgi:hypothetical protein
MDAADISSIGGVSDAAINGTHRAHINSQLSAQIHFDIHSPPYRV